LNNDGNAYMFNHYAVSLGIIGGKLTHGITQDEAALEYYGQPSDILGSVVKQYVLKQDVDEANWLISSGLFRRKKSSKEIGMI
jgi:Zn-dependent metalloprotease